MFKCLGKKLQARTLVKYLKESVFVKFHILPKWSWSLGKKLQLHSFPNQMISTINDFKFPCTSMNPRPIEDISNSRDVGHCT